MSDELQKAFINIIEHTKKLNNEEKNVVKEALTKELEKRKNDLMAREEANKNITDEYSRKENEAYIHWDKIYIPQYEILIALVS